jgi:hypothetical protein
VTIFDLVFILAFFASLMTVVLVLVRVVRGRGGEALVLLRRYGLCVAAYLAVVVLVSLSSPQRVLGFGDKQCSDDWCIAVTDVQRSAQGRATAYRVTFQLSSRARRVPQRETGVVAYLLDGGARRFDSDEAGSAPPFDVSLAPAQAIDTVRVFHVTGAAPPLGIVVGREGSYRFPGLFIIGDGGSLLHKPTIVRVPE